MSSEQSLASSLTACGRNEPKSRSAKGRVANRFWVSDRLSHAIALLPDALCGSGRWCRRVGIETWMRTSVRAMCPCGVAAASGGGDVDGVGGAGGEVEGRDRAVEAHAVSPWREWCEHHEYA